MKKMRVKHIIIIITYYEAPCSNWFLISLISCCDPDTRKTPWWCIPAQRTTSYTLYD